MKRTLSCIGFVVMTAVALFADANLRILEVGLQGYFQPYGPTPIRLYVTNTRPAPQDLQLRIQITNPRTATDLFTAPLALRPGEQREIEVPILLKMADIDTVIEATLADAQGAITASDRVKGQGLTGVYGQTLIAVLCGSDAICKAVQSQISFSGNPEQRARKNRELKFLVLRAPRAYWWSYAAASALVVAAPIADYPAAPRAALEGFVRSGRHLVVAEDQAGDAGFLAVYGNPYPKTPSAQPVGHGMFYRVRTADSPELGAAFAGDELDAVLGNNWTGSGLSPALGWFRRRVATGFSFPRLSWLLGWLAVYVVVVGVLNFGVLRRFRRLEWGWATVCCIALLFAASLFVSSSRHRPRAWTLDDVAVYWMDARSPIAFADFGVRVSAPRRADVTVSVSNPAAVLTYNQPTAPFTAGDLSTEITRHRGRQMPLHVALGAPLQVGLPLLRWSYRDLELQGPRTFAGTVHWAGAGRLRNDTGRRFRQALFVDYIDQYVTVLPANLEPGTEVDVTKLPRQDARQETRPQELNKPFVITEALHAGAALQLAHRRVFIGLSDEPVLAVNLGATPYAGHSASLTVVVLE